MHTWILFKTTIAIQIAPSKGLKIHEDINNNNLVNMYGLFMYEVC